MMNATICRLACVALLGLSTLACGESPDETTTRSTRKPTSTNGSNSDGTTTKESEATSATTTPGSTEKTTTPAPATPTKPTTPTTPTTPMDPPVAIACVTATDSVTAAYKLALLRAPDGPGLSYFLLQVQSGTTRLNVLESLVGSTEFANARAGLDDTRFVTSLFMGFLGREPDAPGRDYWLGQLAGGLSRIQVALAFVRGAEFADPEANPVHACFF